MGELTSKVVHITRRLELELVMIADSGFMGVGRPGSAIMLS